MPHAAQSAIPVHASDVACIDLVNSAFTDHLGVGAGGDRISSAQWQKWFLDRHGLKPETHVAPPLEELVALRRQLRRILEKWASQAALSRHDVRLLDARLSAAPVRERVAGEGGRLELALEPVSRDWSWVLASIAASAVELIRTGDPRRLKTCGNPNCSWMFYDETVNRSRRYCSPSPCGSLIRVRQHRQP